MMARIDDYQQALELVKNELSGKNPDLVAGFSGAEVHEAGDGKTALLLNFLNQDTRISWPDLVATNHKSNEELSIQQQILLLHYLQGAWSSNGPTIKGDWIAFTTTRDGNSEVYLMAEDGSNPYNATRDPAEDFSYTWH